MTNTRRTTRTVNQQPTHHERIITSTPQETNLPPQGSDAPPQGTLTPPLNSNLQLQGVGPPLQKGNSPQRTNFPSINTTQFSLPLTNPLVGTTQVINLENTPHGRSRSPVSKDDPIVLLPLGDPDDLTPFFTEKIMNANIFRRFKMSTIKTCEGISDSMNHI